MKKKIIQNNIKELIIKITFIIILLYVLLFRVFGIVRINNNSMAPNISFGSLLFLYRLNNNYETNDVVFFNKDNKKYVLRVLAKEGEEVSINLDGEFINDKEDLIKENYVDNIIPDNSSITYPYIVPKGEVFVVSDNRYLIEDSRIFGSIKINQIEGKVIGFLKTKGI